jgi:hypothetical protein
METKRRFERLIPAFLILLTGLPFLVGGILLDDRQLPEHLPVEAGAVAPAYEEGVGEDVEEVVSDQYAHVPIPEEVRGIYWTAYTAITSRADELLDYMIDTGLNTVVIDAKMDNGQLIEPEQFRGTLDKLEEAGIYRIARIAVMRDGVYAQSNPSLALRTSGGGYWYDSIGSIWVDPASEQVRDYAIELGKAFYEAGFDEIQYDYVRFASDGAVSAIVYPIYNGVESKVSVMQRFFKQVGESMQSEGIPVSFDLFGMTYWSHKDFNIGQRLVDAFPYADFISPMVYPSHYPYNFEGLGEPALAPYEIVKRSLDKGTELLLGVWSGTEEDLRTRSRPWLQDFDIGAVYTSDLIEAQIAASRDAGASGWILWNARNVYERANYE